MSLSGVPVFTSGRSLRRGLAQIQIRQGESKTMAFQTMIFLTERMPCLQSRQQSSSEATQRPYLEQGRDKDILQTQKELEICLLRWTPMISASIPMSVLLWSSHLLIKYAYMYMRYVSIYFQGYSPLCCSKPRSNFACRCMFGLLIRFCISLHGFFTYSIICIYWTVEGKYNLYPLYSKLYINMLINEYNKLNI